MCDSPTNIIGASGQWCLISGYHFERTFSKEEGLATLKHIKKTSVCKKKTTKKNDIYTLKQNSLFTRFRTCGYDKGLSLS